MTYWLLTLVVGIASNSNIWSQDIVTFVNKSVGDTTGILVDGSLNSNYVNDKSYLTISNSINIGNFTKANGNNKSNEIMAFSKDRPMEIYTPAPWTAGANNVTIPFANKILIPVTIWILYGSFDSVCIKLTSNLLTASTSYKSEKTGIDFSTVIFKDATNNPKAPNYYIPSSGNANTVFTSLKNDIGFTTGQLNVYVTNKITLPDGTWTNAGFASPSYGMIMLASQPHPTLLLHEIGHTFSLGHITGLTDFDWTNSMTQQIRPWSSLLTEGQVVRMHLNPSSIINSVYNARPNKLQRSCTTTNTASNSCPALNKRIWADGTFPAN